MIHGGEIFKAARKQGISWEEMLDFSANLNPLGTPAKISEAVTNAVVKISHYPDCELTDLKEAIGRKEGTPPSFVLCGNGAADLIFRLAHLLYTGKNSAMIFSPTFLEYERAFGCAGWEIRRERRKRLKEERPDQVFDGLKAGDIVIICNPNNPDGELLSREILLDIVSFLRERGVRVLLDECFLDFALEWSQDTCTGFLQEYENLILLKSFTKMYAMAGLRLGYLLWSDEKMLLRLRQAGQDWSVNTLAAEAGLAALSLDGFEEKTRVYVAEERKFLKEGLEKLGLLVSDGKANFLLFRTRHKIPLAEELMKGNILIRECGNYPGLTDRDYRTAVRSRAENEKLLAQLKKILDKEEWRDSQI